MMPIPAEPAHDALRMLRYGHQLRRIVEALFDLKQTVTREAELPKKASSDQIFSLRLFTISEFRRLFT
jgi:hypothetical protein